MAGPGVTSVPMYLSGQEVVGVGKVHARRAHLVQLPAVGGDGVGEVDGVEDLGAAGAGDLHGTHARQARGHLRTGLEGRGGAAAGDHMRTRARSDRSGVGAS